MENILSWSWPGHYIAGHDFEAQRFLAFIGILIFEKRAKILEALSCMNGA
jgi:hypothetical protein